MRTRELVTRGAARPGWPGNSAVSERRSGCRLRRPSGRPPGKARHGVIGLRGGRPPGFRVGPPAVSATGSRGGPVARSRGSFRTSDLDLHLAGLRVHLFTAVFSRMFGFEPGAEHVDPVRAAQRRRRVAVPGGGGLLGGLRRPPAVGAPDAGPALDRRTARGSRRRRRHVPKGERVGGDLFNKTGSRDAARWNTVRRPSLAAAAPPPPSARRSPLRSPLRAPLTCSLVFGCSGYYYSYCAKLQV